MMRRKDPSTQEAETGLERYLIPLPLTEPFLCEMAGRDQLKYSVFSH